MLSPSQRIPSPKWPLLCGLLAVGLLATVPEPAYAQSSQFCHGYARDTAQRQTRGRTVGGGLIGGTGGALIGRAIGGSGAGLAGALIGGTTGSIIGNNRAQNDYNRIYRNAYARCMGQ